MNHVVAFVLLLVAFAAGDCRAQPGDWDFDGDVDQADAIAMAGCLSGPSGSPSPECLGVFDPTGSGKVGMAAVLGMATVVGQQASPTCTRWPTLNEWVGILPTYYSGGVYGLAALIDTGHTPSLCPVLTTQSFSGRWINISGTTNAGQVWWFQTGVARERNEPAAPYPPNTNTTTIYSEVFDPALPSGRRLAFYPFAVPTTSASFMINWRTSWPTNARVFFVADVGWDNYPAPSSSIARRPAEQYQIEGETWHIEDRMGGTFSSPCDFVDCTWAAGAELNFLPTAILPAELSSTASAFVFGSTWVSQDHFRIFDHRP